LNEADRKKHEITAEELPLRKDVVAFLGYLRENKVTGTTSRGNLPLKHVAAVAAGFVDPPAMEIRFGSHAYPVRSEDEVWPVYFVHMLANGANLITGGPGRRWRLTERGVQYFNASPVVQVRILLAGWFFQADWTLTLAYDIFGGSLPSWVPQSVLYLLREIEGGQRAEYNRFIDRLIEKVGWRLEGDRAEEMRKELGLSMERMVVRPLEAMGIMTGERVKDEESPFPREKLAAFSLTHFGMMLLGNTGPWGR
jgi:hypothetical protein